MSRTIEFEPDHLVIRLSGVTSVAALKRRVDVPYASVKHVSVEGFDIPLLQFRVGTSVADLREGRFLIDGKWCFVSYENHENLLILDLVEHEYGKVIIQVENPEEMKRRIIKKLKQ
jgi:hypothetical protein